MNDAYRARWQSAGGVTLVEIVVAILILSVGLLAVAQSATLALRLTAEGHDQWKAATLARSSLDSLRSLGCAALPGSETIDGTLLRWSIGAAATGAPNDRQAVLQVVQPARRGAQRSDTFVGAVPCGS